MRVHWLWLSRISKISPLQKRKLLELYGDAEDIYNADDQFLKLIKQHSSTRIIFIFKYVITYQITLL